MSRFKGARCAYWPPYPYTGGWMNDAARASCVRMAEHEGRCMNKVLTWEAGKAQTVCYRSTGKSVDRTE